jgi:myo-inositol 2-dehydrogenase/D-chiro-inositol 1-dehydrogenase
MTPIRVGVIGVGGMGACHAHNVTELAGAELAWVADPAEDSGRALAQELDTRWVADAASVLDSADALVIACPDRFHSQFAREAIERELPALCEKPLTVELADARLIVDAEASLGRRLLQVGFMRVYDERHRQVAHAVAGLGAVNHVRGVHRNTNDGSRAVKRMLVESIIHDIHSVRWIAGTEITEVATSVVRRDGATRMIILTCGLANGGVATLEFDDMATGYEVSLEVSADGGNVVAADPLRAQVRADGKVAGEIGDDWFSPFLETYRVEMREWIASIRDGVARGPSVWDGYAAQAVVEAAAASAESGGAVPVSLGARPAIYEGAKR